MKTTIMIVLGGLLFAGPALAAEPQEQTTSAALKVGINAKTGELRPLTAEESAALDAQAAPKAAKARTSMAKVNGVILPATYADSVATGLSKNGLVGYLAPVESLSSITATVDGEGNVIFHENGKPMQHSQEMASE